MKTIKLAAAYPLIAAIGMAAMSACTSLVPTSKGESVLVFSLEKSADLLSTRAVEALDTNNFILKVTDSSGKIIYDDRYGSRPRELKVPSGTYDISLLSGDASLLDFDTPVYGDILTVIAAPMENVAVSFNCRMRNAGVRFGLSDNYLDKYPSGTVRVRQSEGYIDCSKGEMRFAYLNQGAAAFYAFENGAETQLFTKTMEPGKMYDISLDVSSSDIRGVFSIASIDTMRTFISETLQVGDKYNGDGMTAATAYSVDAARAHVGDTAWVWGYIVAGDLGSGKVNFEPPFTSTAHMAIAESPTERTRERCFSVNLTRAALKSALNLKDNPGNLGRKVFVRGVIDSSYLKLNGLDPAFEYEFAK